MTFLFKIIPILLLLTAACSSSGKPINTPTPASTPTPQCQFTCDITAGNGEFRYKFNLSCETGQYDTTVGPNARITESYEKDGNLVRSTLDLDHALTYPGSPNSYQITGKIQVDNVTGEVTYDIQVTGGIFGSSPQVCQRGKIVP